MSRIFLGDVHGKIKDLDRICKLFPEDDIIQVGDFGVGFEKIPVYDNLRFIRGNHDNPELCQARTDYIGDWAVENDTLYISGAASHDKVTRIQGWDWWPDEELSISEMDRVLEWLDENPNSIRTVVSHDLPMCFVQEHFKIYGKTRTGQFLDEVRDKITPERWIAGHHHVSYHVANDYGTEFFVLDELEVLKE